MFYHKKFLRKKPLVFSALVLLTGVSVIVYYFTLKFEDSASLKPDYNVDVTPFISEFSENQIASNKKYTEKIIALTGRISTLEQADTTVNVKFVDSLTGSYLICAFQQQHVGETSALQTGDSVTIKGSCSGGIYSNILETNAIFFKRCMLEKKY